MHYVHCEIKSDNRYVFIKGQCTFYGTYAKSADLNEVNAPDGRFHNCPLLSHRKASYMHIASDGIQFLISPYISA